MKKEKTKRIKIEVSARHMHISKEDLEKLFGRGYQLHPQKGLSQKGEFAAEEKVLCRTDKGELSLRIVGPAREKSQIEMSKTDSLKLGMDIPVRRSGNLSGAPKIEIAGPRGKSMATAIVSMRHIHCPSRWAKALGLRDGDRVMVEAGKERKVIFGEVVVRIRDTFTPSCHLDTDEGNAAGLPVVSFGKVIC